MNQWWKSPDDMYAMADQVAAKVAELYDKENITFTDPDLGGISRLLRHDADQFIRLDPKILIEEHERALDVANRVGAIQSYEVDGLLEKVQHNLSDWGGDAADAFRDQLSRIRVFTNFQRDFVLKLTEAFYAKTAVAAQIREDYCTLAQGTVDTLEKAIADADDRTTEFWLKIGGGVAKAVLGGAKSGAEASIDIAIEGMIYLATGHELADIMKSYNKNVVRLLDAYFGELEEVGRLIDNAQKSLLETDFPLFEPLPAFVDVNGPEFRYEHFYPDSDPDRKLGPTVEEERKKYLDEQIRIVDPDSPIHRRLAGEEE